MSSAHISSFVIDFGGVEVSAPDVCRTDSAKIYQFSVLEEQEVLPANVRPVSDFVAQNEKNPERAAFLANARRELAEKLTGEGQTMRSIRLERGLSQSQLAEMIGTKQPHIARIEAGHEVYVSTARKLAEALNLDMNELTDALSRKDQLLPLR